MEIVYVQFIHPVNVGGELGALNSWSKQKHQTERGRVDCAEKGSWIVLTVDGGNTYRVPITNVQYIATAETKQESKR